MSRTFRSVALGVMLVLGWTLCAVPAVCARERVTVRSNNFRYNYYRIEIRGRVDLVNQISSAPCEYGRSWGYDRSGIWVDDGCSAEFDVYDNYEDSNGNGRVSGKTAAIIAGAAGAAILTGVLIANSRKNKNKQPTVNNPAGRTSDDDSSRKEQVPTWLVGTFENRAKALEMGIYDDGTVVIKQNTRERFYGNYYDGKIFYNGLKLKIAKDRDGFTATDLNSQENSYFQRTK